MGKSLDDGGFKVTLHFEGMTDDAKDEDQVTFELDTSMAEVPIQTHPFFDTLKTRYAWDAAKEQFAETLPESSGQQTALSGSGKKPKKNPMFGVDNWLVVGAVFRKTSAARNIPSGILRGIGTVVEKPPGIEQFKISGAAKKRNWLKMAPKLKRKGNAVEITEEYISRPLHQRLTSEMEICMTDCMTTLTPAPKSNASAQTNASHSQQRSARDQNLHVGEPREAALPTLLLRRDPVSGAAHLPVRNRVGGFRLGYVRDKRRQLGRSVDRAARRVDVQKDGLHVSPVSRGFERLAYRLHIRRIEEQPLEEARPLHQGTVNGNNADSALDVEQFKGGLLRGIVLE